MFGHLPGCCCRGKADSSGGKNSEAAKETERSPSEERRFVQLEIVVSFELLSYFWSQIQIQ